MGKYTINKSLIGPIAAIALLLIAILATFIVVILSRPNPEAIRISPTQSNTLPLPLSISTNPSTTQNPLPQPTLLIDIGTNEIGLNNPDWPMEGHDPARTGYNQAEKNLFPPLTLDWKQTIDGYAVDNMSILNDNIALAGMGTEPEHRNQVYMLSANTGEVFWDFILTGGGSGAMAITPVFSEKNVFFSGQGDKKLYALDIGTGELAWERTGYGGYYESQITVYGNYLIIPDTLNGAFSLEPQTGDSIWGSGNYAWSNPIAVRRNLVFATQDDTKVTALNISNGDQVWEYSRVNEYFPWIVAGDKQVYIQASETEVVSLNITNGTEVWTSFVSSYFYKPALMNNTLFIPLQNSGIAAVDTQNGAVLWANGNSFGDIIAANGIIYTSTRNFIYALSAENGNIVWSAELDGDLVNSIAIANGRFFVATIEQTGDVFTTYVYAYGN